MGTWHQDRQPVPLYHETKWTVVETPPNRSRTLSRFDWSSEVDTYLANLEKHQPEIFKHTYVLPPSREGK